MWSPPFAQPESQGGDAMNAILLALLYLGDPTTQEAQGEEGFYSGFRGKLLTGHSLPGLSVGPRTPMQACVCLQVSQILPPHWGQEATPMQLAIENSSSGLKDDGRLGGSWD
ncbi:hypothetical protein HPG69_013876 [Diceros bicornis minor]|uniref:Uncharacterized protein n=1 Tax=Diceros bicornis minor TaxID=77932 RepID=A0A7J7EMW0_DICBM|nr:hypothetical protein HPG69_013876 [Diceros bicornis minor]